VPPLISTLCRLLPSCYRQTLVRLNRNLLLLKFVILTNFLMIYTITNSIIMRKELYLILLSFLLTSITCVHEKDEHKNSLTEIDIVSNVHNMEVINLSQFASEVKYLSLKNKTPQYNNPNLIDFFEDRIVATSEDGLLIYDTTGILVTRFGKKGRGPEEFITIENLLFDKNGQILFADTETLFEFSPVGDFVRNYRNIFMAEKDQFIGSFIPLNDSILFCHVPNQTGKAENKALLINKKGDIKRTYKNYLKFDRAKPSSNSRDSEAQFYYFKNDLYYKDLNNDTLFILNDEFNLIPKYTFNIGKYKEPLSERGKPEPRNRLPYIYLLKVFQTKDYIFLNCALGNLFPAKRLTPKKYALPVMNPVMVNTRNALGIYNKVNHSLVFCTPTSTDNPLFTSGLYNDIDAGPRFFPKKMINDSTMVMGMLAEQFREHINSDDFKSNESVIPEKKKQLLEFANNLSEYDNIVIMSVTIK
jgi:hypothetical protein